MEVGFGIVMLLGFLLVGCCYRDAEGVLAQLFGACWDISVGAFGGVLDWGFVLCLGFLVVWEEIDGMK